MVAVTRSLKYGEFVEDRASRVWARLTEEIGDADPTPVDLSPSTLTVRFRASTLPPGTGAFIYDQVMDKIDAADGQVEHYVTFPAAYGAVEAEIVLIDAAVPGQQTPSTFREVQWKRWHPTVKASQQP